MGGAVLPRASDNNIVLGTRLLKRGGSNEKTKLHCQWDRNVNFDANFRHTAVLTPDSSAMLV